MIRMIVDLAYGELRARRKLGFPSDLDQFTTRFPAFADRLRKQLELACWLEEEPPPLDSTTVRDSKDKEAGQRRAGDYELIEPIAHTRMSVVFKVRHRVLGRVVALKMIPPEHPASAEEVQRFKNEVLAVAQLEHHNLLPILEVGEHEGALYFTSRLIERGTLADNVKRFRGQPRAIARLVQSVAFAIHHAHQRGFLHRDIKPTNVLIDTDDNRWSPTSVWHDGSINSVI